MGVSGWNVPYSEEEWRCSQESPEDEVTAIPAPHLPLEHAVPETCLYKPWISEVNANNVNQNRESSIVKSLVKCRKNNYYPS